MLMIMKKSFLLTKMGLREVIIDRNAIKISYAGQKNIFFCRVKENAGQPMQLYIHEVVDVETLKKRSSSLDATTSRF